jgi:hypothetical protein
MTAATYMITGRALAAKDGGPLCAAARQAPVR